MVSQQRSLFRQLPQTVSQTSRVASPVDSSWGRIAEMASVSSRTLRMASAERLGEGVCHILQPGRKGQRVIRAVGQVCDKPLVQPAAVQEQKGCAAQKQVDDSGDLEQTCPEGDERHQREQEKYTGNEKPVFSGEIAHQQTAHRQDQHGKSGIRCAQDCAAGCQCAADYAAGTPELLCPD